LSAIACDDDDSAGDVATRTASFQVDPGETVTCTFTNKAVGKIIIKKQTDPAGSTRSFEFTGAVNGSISAGRSLEATVSPGTHLVTETAVAGWAPQSITCDDTDSTGNLTTRTATINVAPAETVTCTFVNASGMTIDAGYTFSGFNSPAGVTIRGGDTVRLFGPGFRNVTEVCFLVKWHADVKGSRGSPQILWNGSPVAGLDQTPGVVGDNVVPGLPPELLKKASVRHFALMNYCTEPIVRSTDAVAGYPWTSLLVTPFGGTLESVGHDVTVTVKAGSSVLATIVVDGSTSKGGQVRVAWNKSKLVILPPT
jgi:hypothetical protein